MISNNQEVPRGLKPLQKSFFSLLGQEKPKPIPPKLVRIYGYPLSAIISQLLFWNGMGIRKDGYIFKTEKDFIAELGLSSAQQKLAIKKGKAFGFLRVVRKGIPAKRHYKLNYNALVEATISEATNKKIALTKRPLNFGQTSPSKYGDNKPTITESTQKNTTRKHRAESVGSIMARYGGKL